MKLEYFIPLGLGLGVFLTSSAGLLGILGYHGASEILLDVVVAMVLGIGFLGSAILIIGWAYVLVTEGV